MTNDNSSTPKGLRDEAAEWFAIMRGPEAEARRAEFGAWLARGRLHRTAYNRIAETFSLGKGLKAAAEAQEEHKETPAPPRTLRRVLVGGIATAAILGALGLGYDQFQMHNEQGPAAHVASDQPHAPAQLATRTGEIRRFSLADGSAVTLDSDSLVLVSVTVARRDLRLMRGRARFTVAHDTRPFVVAVAGGTVTARGTVFDVALDGHDRVVVRLLRGSVDVRLAQTAPGNTVPTPVRRMTPGEVLQFGKAPSSPAKQGSSESKDWPEGIVDLDRVRLPDLVAQANRYATKPLVLASPGLVDMRLSGTFRIRDTSRLAENIADVLGLAVIDRRDAIVLARSCPGKSQENCRPPS